eukprot:7059380-Prymnesium_polylepis.1
MWDNDPATCTEWWYLYGSKPSIFLVFNHTIVPTALRVLWDAQVVYASEISVFNSTRPVAAQCKLPAEAPVATTCDELTILAESTRLN